MKNVSILGSTGSIGTQSIEVIKKLKYNVVGLSAYSNVELLEKQARELTPKIVCIYKESLFDNLKQRLVNTSIKVVCGMEGLCEVATVQQADIVINAVVGMIGLVPTLKAIENKKDIALANKETLVTGGEIVMQKAIDNGVNIYPIDSEHSAIFQAMQGNKKEQVKKIILTASGGPFFGKTNKELENVSLEQTLSHPNWNMGKKITVDSATLMNKGLELIEACHLFDKAPDDIEIVVHKQSIVHSLVEFDDNSVMAQLGIPDMKIPIQYSLTYPDRVKCEVKRLSLTDIYQLTFEKPDIETFVCLKACCKAISRGGLYPTIVNGANEMAVELFLQNKISFLEIGEIVYASLKIDIKQTQLSVESIINADKIAREFVLSYTKQKEIL